MQTKYTVKEHTEHKLNQPLLFQLKPVKTNGEVAAKLITSFYCVYEDAEINDTADEISHNEEIFAVAVVDHQLKPKGIVLRKDIFDLLGKPYCRDAYHHKPIKKIQKKAEVFQGETSIFSIIDHLSDDLKKPANTFYLISDDLGRTMGIVSTRRILGYLSDISQKDIHLAKKVQNSVVKEQTHILKENFEFLASSQMAKEVGGDYYFIKEYKKGRWTIAICDVSGKGIAASLVTTALGGMFNTFDFNRGIKAFINTVNQFFIDSFYMEKYATAVVMDFNETTGELLLCDMGHKHIFIHRTGGLSRVKTNEVNLPIGIIPEGETVFNRINLQKGESMILMTDGLIEQRNDKGEEYPLQRFASIIHKTGLSQPQTLKEKTMEDMNRFRGNRTQGDDITLLILRYKGETSKTISPQAVSNQLQIIPA